MNAHPVLADIQSSFWDYDLGKIEYIVFSLYFDFIIYQQSNGIRPTQCKGYCVFLKKISFI